MRKLKLPQPYASMVVSGTLEVIPDIWGDVKYGEKIFIYADNIAEDFKNGLNYSKALHQKVFNEMFLGNIPDNIFVSEAFLGYVIVHNTGRLTQYWPKDIERFLFVTTPHKFKFPIDDYSTNFHDLENIQSEFVKNKKIKRNGHLLIVPVGKNVWNQLRDKKAYKNLYLFWENYMNKIVPSEWGAEDEEPIDLIKFEHQHTSIMFDTNCSTGWTIPALFNDGINDKGVSIFNFDLEQLSPYSRVGFYSDKEKTHSKDSRKNWTHVIFIPMGGMTRWKRK